MKKLPIYHIEFPNRRTMNLAMGRVSEYRENQALVGKVFTWDELEAWWATTPNGKRTTFVNYWDGFNVPVSEFRPFLKGRFPNLTAEERAVLKIVRGLPKDAYVIATARNVPATLPHEVVHGLYACRPAYGKQVDRAVRSAMRRKAIPNILAALTRMGYGKQAFVDEVNAYLTTGIQRGERMNGPGERELRRVLRGILRAQLGYVFTGKEGERRAAALVHRIRFPRL